MLVKVGGSQESMETYKNWEGKYKHTCIPPFKVEFYKDMDVYTPPSFY